MAMDMARVDIVTDLFRLLDLRQDRPWATSIFPSRLRSSKCRRAAGPGVFVLER
jgi:hypothetical protein